jgi:hypothetical protein
LYVIDGLGETPIRQVSLDIPADHILCVAWPETEIAASGKVLVCDQNYFSIG